MRKYYIIWILFFYGSLTLFSQDLVIMAGERIVNNDSVYLSGTKTSELIELRLSVTNSRPTAVSLKLKKTEIFVVEGAENSFCWGECYIPTVYISPMTITLQPSETDNNSFIGEYRPYEMEGTSTLKYTFFDPSDTTFQESVTVFYQIGGSGIPENSNTQSGVQVFPNPASDFILISFPPDRQSESTASLINVLGQRLFRKDIPLTTSRISLPVSDYPPGLYFVEIKEKTGRNQTYRVLIRH